MALSSMNNRHKAIAAVASNNHSSNSSSFELFFYDLVHNSLMLAFGLGVGWLVLK